MEAVVAAVTSGFLDLDYGPAVLVLLVGRETASHPALSAATTAAHRRAFLERRRLALHDVNIRCLGSQIGTPSSAYSYESFDEYSNSHSYQRRSPSPSDLSWSY